MTARAIIIGLLGVVFISVFGYVNDQVLKLESFNSGQFIPVLIFGGLMIFLGLINPALFALDTRLAFRPSELAVAIGMLLVAIGIPGRGLTEQFTQILAMPAHWNDQSVEWRANRVFDYVPPAVYPAEGKYDREVQEGFIRGVGRPGKPIGLDGIPWAKWRKPLTLWIPLVLLSAACAISLAMIFHRQWSGNEQLRYPIASFADTLLRRDEGRPFSAVFYDKAFWVGLGIILAIRGINGINVWLDGRSIEIPMDFYFGQFVQKFQVFEKVPILFWVPIFPIAIAFSFFLASDISLTLGLTQYFWAAAYVVLVTEGVDVRTDYELGGIQGWHRAGAYAALGLMLLYSGRSYYWRVVKSALLRWRGGGPDSTSAWALRVLVVCLAAMVAIVASLGLSWPLALLLILLILLTFVCVSRISAETGLFFVQAGWSAVGVLFGLMGSYALGPRSLIVAGVVSMVLCACPSMCLMPYVLHALRIGQHAGLAPRRIGWTSMGVYALGVGIAVPATLWACYNFGSPDHFYYFHRLPTVPLRAANEAITELKHSAELEQSDQLSPAERLVNIQPRKGFVWSAASGFVLVLACSAMRLRFTWWPIHPILFLVWATWPMQLLGHSFMIGWLLKTLVVRFGGTQVYNRFKPAMFGIVAGEMLSGVIFMGVGAIYYAVRGIDPPVYTVFPR